MKTFLKVAGALAVAAMLWLPCLHFFFRPRLADYVSSRGLAPRAQALARYQLRLWSDPAERTAQIERMRRSNAEWDFMGRTFLVLALANMGLRNPPAQSEYLAVMDTIIDETLRREKERGMYYFLMDYAKESPFRASTGRSLFQDGEIALMLAARRMLAERDDYKPLLQDRVRLIRLQMEQSPVLAGESYPNECWMFCNSIAAVAMHMRSVLDGSDDAAFAARWLATAREKLVDPRTGLLVSSFTPAGVPLDGPEGSSIWLVAHCLAVLDPAFARDQYDRARRELGANVLGFGYAKEWPATWRGEVDIDSGPVIPFLDISAGSSGTAFLGAAAFHDEAFLASLLTSLHFGGFPQQRGEDLRFLASNQVGDAVLLYALVSGPLWDEVRRRGGEQP